MTVYWSEDGGKFTRVAKPTYPIPPAPEPGTQEWSDMRRHKRYTSFVAGNQIHVIEDVAETERIAKKMATQAETDGYAVGHAFGVLLDKQLDMSEFEELRTLAETFARNANYSDMRLGGAYIRAFCAGYIDAMKGTNKSAQNLLASPIESEDE